MDHDDLNSDISMRAELRLLRVIVQHLLSLRTSIDLDADLERRIEVERKKLGEMNPERMAFEGANNSLKR